MPKELRLDVVEAAEAFPGKPFAKQLQTYREAKKPGDLTAYDETLFGGDAASGRDIFLNNATLSCLRCHKAGGEGGEVGPNLAGIGAEKQRDYLLESIVLPNKQIAKGFESIVIVKLSGETDDRHRQGARERHYYPGEPRRRRQLPSARTRSTSNGRDAPACRRIFIPK